LLAVVFLDLLSTVSDSDFVYVTAASRLSIVSLLPLGTAIAASLWLALAGRLGGKGEPVEVRTLVVLDLSLVTAVASVATRDHSDLLRGEPSGWPAIVFALLAALVAGVGTASLLRVGVWHSSAAKVGEFGRTGMRSKVAKHNLDREEVEGDDSFGGRAEIKAAEVAIRGGAQDGGR